MSSQSSPSVFPVEVAEGAFGQPVALLGGTFPTVQGPIFTRPPEALAKNIPGCESAKLTATWPDRSLLGSGRLLLTIDRSS
jgi:hypothetical protein